MPTIRTTPPSRVNLAERKLFTVPQTQGRGLYSCGRVPQPSGQQACQRLASVGIVMGQFKLTSVIRYARPTCGKTGCESQAVFQFAASLFGWLWTFQPMTMPQGTNEAAFNFHPVRIPIPRHVDCSVTLNLGEMVVVLNYVARLNAGRMESRYGKNKTARPGRKPHHRTQASRVARTGHSGSPFMEWWGLQEEQPECNGVAGYQQPNSTSRSRRYLAFAIGGYFLYLLTESVPTAHHHQWHSNFRN